MNKFMRMFFTVGFALAACGGNDTKSKTNDRDTSTDDETGSDGGVETDSDWCASNNCADETDEDDFDGGSSSCGNCDDGIACTDDVCDQGECRHLPLHGRCELGTICDPDNDCTDPPPCASVADCPDLDGPCLQETCDTVSATCMYTPLDADEDGHPPQRCETVGGDDCDDSNADVNPAASEICNGLDDDCDGIIDNNQECALCQEALEICNGLDDDCDGLTDDGITCRFCSDGNDCDGTTPICTSMNICWACSDDEECNDLWNDFNCDADGSCQLRPQTTCNTSGACAGGNRACTGAFEMCAGTTACTPVACDSDADCSHLGGCDIPPNWGQSFGCDATGQCKKW